MRKLQGMHGSLLGGIVGAGLGALLVANAPPAGADGAPADGASPRRVTIVEEGLDTLKAAVAQASPGDILLLRPGLYELGSTVVIDKDLAIRGTSWDRGAVHIAGVGADEFDFQPEIFGDQIEDLPKWGHLLFVTDGARRVSLAHFTIKNAPEIDGISEDFCEANFGLNLTECFGDAIHSDGAAEIVIYDVEASLNAGNGIWVDGATRAVIWNYRAVNNGAFGIDVDTAAELWIEHGVFIANQVSGIEASGHGPGLHRDEYTATVTIKDARAWGNGEIGIEVERFKTATLTDVVCADNREDGFDADRVSEVRISHGRFINNLDDGMELFPVDVADPNEQPADFPGSIVEVYNNLRFSGNVGEDINHAPTEN